MTVSNGARGPQGPGVREHQSDERPGNGGSTGDAPPRTIRHWVVRRARMFERLYHGFAALLFRSRSIVELVGPERLEPLFVFGERHLKGLLFDCQMCGQCILSDTGMSCPTNCPKSDRNGPCGGVRPNGNCEVDAGMRCVWVEAWEGSARMSEGASINKIQPALDTRLRNTSAWLRSIRNVGRPSEVGAASDGSRVTLTQVPARPPTHVPALSSLRTPVEAAPVPFAGARLNQLEQVLRSGQFAVTAELSPPDSADPSDVLRPAAVLADLVDAINVTDASGANCHISSVSVSALLTMEGLTPVMQVTCRDRNRIAIQGDILGAAALGIANLLCLTGDGIASGDHPGAVPVHDLDSVSLLETARTMRDDGRFLSGRRLAVRPRLFLGAACNPFAPPYPTRALHLAKKVAAGAQFVQTQYCFDLPMLERFMTGVRELGLHQKCFILVGVGPLPSARTARWMRASVPGVHIPDQIVERLEKARDPRREGRQICVELIQQIRDVEGVAGVHLMAHRNEKLIAEVIGEAGIRGPRSNL